MKRDYTLNDIFNVVLRNIIWILAATAAVGAITFAYCTISNRGKINNFVPSYYSSVDLLFSTSTSDTDSGDSVTLADINSITNMLNTYSDVLKSDAYCTRVSEALHGDLSPAEVSGAVSFSTVYNTTLLKMTATCRESADCKRLCEEYISLADELASQTLYHGKVTALGISEPAATQPSTTNAKLFALAFAFVTFVLACAFFIIKNLRQPVIDDSDDISAMYDLSVLGRINKKNASLAYASAAARILPTAAKKVVLINCDDDNSAAAIEFAKASAELGRKTLLIDACFDAPALSAAVTGTNQLGAKSRELSGFTDLLSGEAGVSSITDEKGFDFLTCGKSAISPCELAEKLSRSDILDPFTKDYDTVYIYCGAADKCLHRITLAGAADAAIIGVNLHETTHSRLDSVVTDMRIACGDNVSAVIY